MSDTVAVDKPAEGQSSTDDLVGEPVGSGGTHRRWRWRWLALAVVVAMLGSALLAALRYRPLEHESLSTLNPGPSDDNPLTFADIRSVSTVSFPDEDQIRVRPSGRFVFGFTLRNQGRFAVKVTQLPLPTEGFLQGAGVRIGTVDDPGPGLPPLERFRPFILRPGKERFVELHYRFLPCAGSPSDADWAARTGSTGSWNTQRVDYALGPLKRHMVIDLPRAIAIYSASGPNGSSCGYG